MVVNDYTVLATLGKGSYAEVLLCQAPDGALYVRVWESGPVDPGLSCCRTCAGCRAAPFLTHSPSRAVCGVARGWPPRPARVSGSHGALPPGAQGV